MSQRLLLTFSLFAVLFIAGCGANVQNNFHSVDSTSGNSGTPSSTFAVSLLPTSPSVTAGQSLSFLSPFIGPVVWKVNGIEGGDSVHGTIGNSGIFRAPNVAPVDPVTVTAQLGSFVSSPQASTTVTILNPVPRLDDASPKAVFAGGPTVTLTISGIGFLPGSQVLLNEQPLTKTFVDSGHLTALIPDAYIRAAGIAKLSVSNPLPGGGPSAQQSFTVLAGGEVTSTRNSLVAAYTVAAPDASTVSVEFGPDLNYGFNTSQYGARIGGGTLRILVAGMKPSSDYHMRAKIRLSDGTTLYDADRIFTTGGLPSTMAFPNVTTQYYSGVSPSSGVELLSLSTPGEIAVAATDLDGNYVWYYDNSSNLGYVNQPVKLLPNGHLLLQFQDFSQGNSDGTGSVLREIDLEGNTIWEMTGPDLNKLLADAGFTVSVIGTHHDFAVLPNGHLIVIASVNEPFNDLIGFPGTTMVLGDVVIDLDTNHKPVWLWSTFDHLDVNRHLLSFPDWTHTNAVIYSADDGNLLLSFRHQSWIIKIDYRNGAGSGDILWRLGWQGDFQLIGGNDPVDWFFAQHAPHFASSSTAGAFDLLLFDNGNNRVLDTAGNICGSAVACESTIPLWHIDEQQKTATLLWRDSLGMFSVFGGYVQNFASGDIEFAESAPTFTVSSIVQEVTNTSPPQPIWQMTIDGSYAYRALRIPSLYPGVTWK